MPLISVGAVVIALVLERDLRCPPDQVGLGEKPSPSVHDLGVDFRPRKVGVDDGGPELTFRGGVGATRQHRKGVAEQTRSATSLISRQCGTYIAVARERVAPPQETVASRDELGAPQSGGRKIAPGTRGTGEGQTLHGPEINVADDHVMSLDPRTFRPSVSPRSNPSRTLK